MATSRRRSESTRAQQPEPAAELVIDGSPLAGLVGYAVRRVQLALFQDIVNVLQSHKIRPAQFSVMALLEANPGVTQSSLAQALGVDPPRMVNLIHDLEEQGLALRVRCKQDRRSHGVFLSKKGETLLAELKTLVEASDRHMTHRLSAAEREQLLELLGRVG
jgi:DNA-binding MarR family transcriptional regulator